MPMIRTYAAAFKPICMIYTKKQAKNKATKKIKADAANAGYSAKERTTFIFYQNNNLAEPVQDGLNE
ncbi:hypothetical protein PCURB6_38430 [Paenibacillus curdlanolyticus]|nr:hypothetical protein PCURB6_38430 [Paenibacillus curdlanolyticus]